jgi:hypothetical protein
VTFFTWREGSGILLTMSGAKTVFVVGAGASKPYGLPTGGDLRDIICHDALAPDPGLQSLGVDPKGFRKFQDTLLHSGRSSVDAFLGSRPDHMEIGKLAIALALLPLEVPSRLFRFWIKNRRSEVHPTATEQGCGHWYELLFNMLTGDRTFAELDLARVGVVTFNYDRSFEEYLFVSLLNSYGRSREETAARFGEMPFVHVHGSLGRLPWQPEDKAKPAVPYGAAGDVPGHVSAARDSIIVLHEADQNSLEFERARRLIAAAQQVYFLGFGFHRTNLERLGMGQIGPQNPSRGTIQGLSGEALAQARSFAFLSLDLSANNLFMPTDVCSFVHDHVVLPNCPPRKGPSAAS